MRLSIIGGGRAAWAFGSSWQAAGWIVSSIGLRESSTSTLPERLSVPRVTVGDDFGNADIILVAVPDDAITSIAAKLAARTNPATYLFHPSGSLDSALFGDQARTFSLHPLRALPRFGEPEPLSNSLMVFEGDRDSKKLAQTICSTFGARFAEIDRPAKPAYHAAAVIAANLTAAQLHTAMEVISSAGIDSIDVREELAALAESAIRNWVGNEGSERFTGPITRRDAATITSHLERLRGTPAETIYRTTSLALCNALLDSTPDDRSLIEIKALLEDTDHS